MTKRPTPLFLLLLGLWSACERDHQQIVTDLLHIASKGKSAKVREEACEELGHHRGEKVTEALIQYLDDPVLQYCAAHGLGQIGDTRAVSPLLEHLQTKAGFNPMALWALGELGDPKTLQKLKELDAAFVPSTRAEQAEKEVLRETINKLTRKINSPPIQE